MLPLIERLELSRRYSRRRDDFASRFAHGYVLEFFSKATGSAGYSLRPTQNTGLSRGMAESGKLGKHTRSWRDVSVIEMMGIQILVVIGVIGILHLCEPIAHLRRVTTRLEFEARYSRTGKMRGSRIGERKVRQRATGPRAHFDDEHAPRSVADRPA